MSLKPAHKSLDVTHQASQKYTSSFCLSILSMCFFGIIGRCDFMRTISCLYERSLDVSAKTTRLDVLQAWCVAPEFKRKLGLRKPLSVMSGRSNERRRAKARGTKGGERAVRWERRASQRSCRARSPRSYSKGQAVMGSWSSSKRQANTWRLCCCVVFLLRQVVTSHQAFNETHQDIERLPKHNIKLDVCSTHIKLEHIDYRLMCVENTSSLMCFWSGNTSRHPTHQAKHIKTKHQGVIKPP